MSDVDANVQGDVKYQRSLSKKGEKPGVRFGGIRRYDMSVKDQLQKVGNDDDDGIENGDSNSALFQGSATSVEEEPRFEMGLLFTFLFATILASLLVLHNWVRGITDPIPSLPQ